MPIDRVAGRLSKAMMLGTPVVATDHGGNPEAICDGINGYLVAPEQPDAFVEPIRRLLSDGATWNRISAAAQASALETYSVTKHVSGIARIYERLAGDAAGDWQRRA